MNYLNSNIISSSEVCSTTDSDDEAPHIETENAEKENQENGINLNRQVGLNEAQIELQYFPEVAEIDCNDDEDSFEISNSQKENFLSEGIKNTTMITMDLCEHLKEINDVQAKSEEIENELKIKHIQYKTLEMQAECLSLFVDTTLKEMEHIPYGEIRQFTDEEIEKLSS